MASSNADLQRLELALDKVLQPVQHLLVERDRLTEYQLIARGGFGSVSTAQLRAHPESTDFQIVAVKELLPLGDDVQRIKLNMSFARELRVWSRVDHPNVLPLTGFFLDANATVALFIAPFEPHGNLRRYLERALASDVPLSDTRRLGLAVDTASGLSYLHTREPPICHGDIKSLNILISAEGRAKLCDFGLAKIIDDHPSGFTTEGFEAANTAFYMSYELACVPGALRTLMSDVWAWGGVSLEIFTGQSPYGHCKSGQQVYFQMFHGVPPASLESLRVSHRIRNLLQRCWEKAPESRITIAETCNILAEEKLSLGREGHNSTSSPNDLDAGNYPIREISQAYENTVQNDHILSETLERLQKYRLTKKMIRLVDMTPIPGGFGMTYQGSMRKSFRWASVGAPVGINVFLVRGDQMDWTETICVYAKQADLWANLNHPNVLPFLGFDLNAKSAEVKWVTPWMANGTLMSYISGKGPSQKERIQLSLEVAQGVLYLHTLNPAVLHGDLRAFNILVSSTGQAVISNFVLAESAGRRLSLHEFRGHIRWCAPELLQENCRSLETDVWAWGCLLIEIFLGCIPFSRVLNDTVAMYKVAISKDPPATPEELYSLPAKLRQHMETCWKFRPDERPTIQDGLEVLNSLMEARGGARTVEPVSSSSGSDGTARIVHLIDDAVHQGIEDQAGPVILHRDRPLPRIIHLGTSRESPSTSTTGALTSGNNGDSVQIGKKDRLARVKGFFGGPRSGSD